MKNLDEQELKTINGGIIKLTATGIALITGAVASFVIGVFSGYMRPYPCSSVR